MRATISIDRKPADVRLRSSEVCGDRRRALADEVTLDCDDRRRRKSRYSPYDKAAKASVAYPSANMMWGSREWVESETQTDASLSNSDNEFSSSSLRLRTARGSSKKPYFFLFWEGLYLRGGPPPPPLAENKGVAGGHTLDSAAASTYTFIAGNKQLRSEVRRQKRQKQELSCSILSLILHPVFNCDKFGGTY